MKQYFKIGFIHHLTYEEFYVLIGDILKMIQQYEIEDAGVQTLIKHVQGHMPDLDYVVKRTRLHKNTAIIGDLALERRRTFSSLRYGIKAAQYAETEEQRDAWPVLNNWLREEKKARHSQRVIRHTGMFSRMNRRLEHSEELQQAMKTLRLTPRFEKIMRLNGEIMQLNNNRIKDLTKFAITSESLRQKSHKDLINLLKMMEVWANTEGDYQQHYHELCSDISSVMKETDRILKFRKTMAKKAEEKKKGEEGQQEPPTDDPEE